MKRPSFQFYPEAWKGNAKLGRATKAERGAWIDVLCLLHDSDDAYGVLCWPLRDLAEASHSKLADLKALVAKQILKGADTGENFAGFVYTPRHGGKDGEPVTLIQPQAGPVWYSSRMVRDEYVRSKRGEGTRFESPTGTPNPAPKVRPKPTIGSEPKPTPTQREGHGPMSSSSSVSVLEVQKHGRAARSPSAQGFAEFYAAYPKKKAPQDAEKAWQKLNPDEGLRGEIMTALEAQKQSRDWSDMQFIPHPATWLNKARWKDEVSRGTAPIAQQDQVAQAWLEKHNDNGNLPALEMTDISPR